MRDEPVLEVSRSTSSSTKASPSSLLPSSSALELAFPFRSGLSSSSISCTSSFLWMREPGRSALESARGDHAPFRVHIRPARMHQEQFGRPLSQNLCIFLHERHGGATVHGRGMTYSQHHDGEHSRKREDSLRYMLLLSGCRKIAEWLTRASYVFGRLPAFSSSVLIYGSKKNRNIDLASPTLIFLAREVLRWEWPLMRFSFSAISRAERGSSSAAAVLRVLRFPFWTIVHSADDSMGATVVCAICGALLREAARVLSMCSVVFSQSRRESCEIVMAGTFREAGST